MAHSLRRFFHQRLVTPAKYPLQQSNRWFFEPDRKGGYQTKIAKSTKEHIKEGLGYIKPELIKFKNEWVRNFKGDRITELTPVEHNDYEIIWRFEEQPEVESWVVTADSDHGEGKSEAEFVLGPSNTGLFRGNLDTTVPKDGVIKDAGYANIRSPVNMVSHAMNNKIPLPLP